MRSWIWIGVVAMLGACGEEAPGDPAILSFTVDPGSGPAGALVDLHVEVENFVITGDEGHDHDAHSHEGDGDDHAQGHVHVYFDTFEGNPIAMMHDVEAQAEIPADAEPGTHVLLARLHGSDHLILEPEVVAEVEFEVLP